MSSGRKVDLGVKHEFEKVSDSGCYARHPIRMRRKDYTGYSLVIQRGRKAENPHGNKEMHNDGIQENTNDGFTRMEWDNKE